MNVRSKTGSKSYSRNLPKDGKGGGLGRGAGDEREVTTLVIIAVVYVLSFSFLGECMPKTHIGLELTGLGFRFKA